jgi:hypothetical protein
MTDKPYDEYVDRAMSGPVPTFTINSYLHRQIVAQDKHFTLKDRDLRAMLADAWLAGLAYSLELIETERGRRNV